MRGRAGRCRGRGFGSTYEGLKRHNPWRLIREEDTGFGSTYEGLKRVLRRRAEDIRHRFGSTYEGLKLFHLLITEEAVRTVLAVPMRA